MNENQIRDYVKEHLWTTFKRIGIEQPVFQEEYPIQVGSSRCRADLVVLIKGEPILIVECKQPGIVSPGPKQLESYLCATPIRLGIFANNRQAHNWLYFQKNTITNKCTKISRQKFLGLVGTPSEIERSIQEEVEQYIKRKVEQRVTPSAIQERANQMIEKEAEQRVTKSAIQERVERQLRQNIASLQRKIDTLEREKEEMSMNARRIQGNVEHQLRQNIASLKHKIDTLEREKEEMSMNTRRAVGCVFLLIFLTLLAASFILYSG